MLRYFLVTGRSEARVETACRYYPALGYFGCRPTDSETTRPAPKRDESVLSRIRAAALSDELPWSLRVRLRRSRRAGFEHGRFARFARAGDGSGQSVARQSCARASFVSLPFGRVRQVRVWACAFSSFSGHCVREAHSSCVSMRCEIQRPPGNARAALQIGRSALARLLLAGTIDRSRCSRCRAARRLNEHAPPGATIERPRVAEG